MRKLISLLLVVGGAFMLLTSFVMYIVPTGRIAYWADYHFLWLTKEQWGDLHTTFGVLIVICSLFHLLLNIKPICNYLRNKSRKINLFSPNLIISLMLCIYIGVGTIFSLPPINFVLNFADHLKEQAEQKYGVPPYGHAELSSLAAFCKKMDLDADNAMALLIESQIYVQNTKQTLRDIAVTNKKTPQEIYLVIQNAKRKNLEIVQSPKTVGDNAQSQSVQDMHYPGIGRMSFGELCEEQGIAVDGALEILQENGVEAHPSQTVKEISESAGLVPMDIFELIQ